MLGGSLVAQVQMYRYRYANITTIFEQVILAWIVISIFGLHIELFYFLLLSDTASRRRVVRWRIRVQATFPGGSYELLELRLFIFENRGIILCLSKTWLMGFTGFDVVRKDTLRSNSDNSSLYLFHGINRLCFWDFESLFFEISSYSEKLFFILYCRTIQ